MGAMTDDIRHETQRGVILMILIRRNLEWADSHVAGAVHIPLQAKADVSARYPAGGKPGTQNNPTYAAMVESMDDSVGRVLAPSSG